jgi:hypothetical protein
MVAWFFISQGANTLVQAMIKKNVINAWFFMVLVSTIKNCNNFSNLIYFYMIPILMYYENKWNNLDWI